MKRRRRTAQQERETILRRMHAEGLVSDVAFERLLVAKPPFGLKVLRRLARSSREYHKRLQ